MRSFLMALIAVCFCVSCASTQEAEERTQAVEEDIETVLSEPLDPDEYGQAKRCLSASEYRSFRVLDDRRIVFEGSRGRLWLNTLHMRCFDLRDAEVLRVKSISSMSRICNLDSFEPADWFDWPWYRRWPWRWGSSWQTTSCTLGKFQPVNESQVQAIKAALRND